MSFKHRLRTLLICLPLLLGALGGMPMRPEEIEELMHSTNAQKIGYTIATESDNGDEYFKNLDQGSGVRGQEADLQE